MKSVILVLAMASLVGCASKQEGPPAPPKPSVWFVAPVDGATVGEEFNVVFGLIGKTIHPAGEIVEGTGHHHLIVDGGAVQKGLVVPANKTHIHFGKGQTDTSLKLSKGKHVLTLQFADGAHQSFGEEMSASITVNVQ